MTASGATPPHEFPTEHLTLRSARAGDGVALHAAIGASLPDMFPWLSFSKSLSDIETMEDVSVLGQRSFADNEFYVWRAWNANGVMVGSVDLHQINLSVPSCEIGYWLHSEHTGRGLAQEMVQATIDIARQSLGVVRIEARCDERNTRSWRVAERLGFALEGIARQDSRDAAGKLCDTRIYALVFDT